MVRKNIVFIGEENRINSELFQLLNWQFEVKYETEPGKISIEEICEFLPAMIMVGLSNSNFDFSFLFEDFMEKCADIPVVTIGTEAESERYTRFYAQSQFHKILRPIIWKSVLEKCKAVMDGEAVCGPDSEATIQERTEKPHILIVDDNAIMLRQMKGNLEGNYSVAVAASGIKAFVAMGKKVPDLILLDYEMPEMNGKEVLKKIQEEEELKNIPVIFLTSADSKEIVVELLALKPAGYILKPVDLEMLYYKIEGILGK
ncbi:MAG: response regulator [Lachnospiraceae bacterium]|nr:response regulator [Lachnospiraceae bacterium]